MKIIGLAGSIQSGKTELEHVYSEFGLKFINLNLEGDRARSSYMKPLFEELVPGGFMPNGKKNVNFYGKVAQTPGMFDHIMSIELPIIQEYALNSIKNNHSGTLLLSWEYLYLLAPVINFDKIILLNCQDQDVWFRRLAIRSAERGLPNPPMDFLLDVLEKNGLTTIVSTTIKTWPTECLVVDTSTDDWGAENLRRALAVIQLL